MAHHLSMAAAGDRSGPPIEGLKAAVDKMAAWIGQADGVMQYWFNGTLVIDRHDMMFRTGARPNIKFHQFLIAPYIGDGSPVDQYMWVEDLTVATAKP